MQHENEVAICSNVLKKYDELEILKLIKSKGIRNVFLWWGDDDDNIKKAKLCQKLGLNVVFAHLEYKNANFLWTDGPDGDKFVENYKRQFKLLQKCKIPIAIMHAQRTPTPPPVSDVGLKRFKELVFWAEKFNVVLAIENSWRLDYIDYLFENISSPFLKICYDSGHDHSFTHDKFNFKKYNGKIIAVHLHDNDGTEDGHLLPFDGNIDWKKVVKKIKSAGYKGTVTLEPSLRETTYKGVPLEKFIELALERGTRLAKMFEEKF